jgi:hypothetical protein
MRSRCWGRPMKIERKHAGGAWTYTDPNVHEAAVNLLVMHGISLEKIDDWIECGPWDAEQLARVMEWRERMLTTDSADAAEAWGMFLTALVHLNVRVLPLAIMGKRHSEAQRARRKDKPSSADDPRRNRDRNESVRLYHARLVAQGRHDATAATAAEFDLSARTIRRIIAT